MLRFVHSRKLFGCTAAMLLALIVADLGDASCDPLPTAFATFAMTGVQEGGPEACRDGCIPDCFCCSRPLLVARAFSPENPGPIAGRIFVHPLRPPAEFSDVIDHVPLAFR